MIGRLKGRLDEKSPGEVLVDCGGVGYQAQISLATFYRLPAVGEPVDLFTVTNLRENALELFAFADRRERALFNLLRGVSGIGPRMALAILSGIDADELSEVLRSGSSERLVAIPGIGKKTAQRVVLELKEKVGGEPEVGDSVGVLRDAVLALVTLGYRERDADQAVRQSREAGAQTVEDLIKQSLARLS
ncbi:MAG: Holliday junction branch migration protein RuvA [Deltaproteobacteria bacterium]|nr:MAG: Holliday junction branch migration protein RuvA [Deltaproteobacteria bacterium]